MIEQSIIDYLKDKSRGVINLSIDHARQIVSMVSKDLIPEMNFKSIAVAKLYRWNMNTKLWELLRMFKTTDAEINVQIRKALEEGPTLDFYKWELINSVGENEGSIYTHDPHKFIYHC